MPEPFIYINGWPGSGKHTTAKALERHLGEKARVVHNHLHIDLAGAILPRTSPEYYPLRQQLREVFFQTLAAASETFDYIYIFTDSQTDDPVGRSVTSHYAQAASDRGCAFIPVVLICDEEENLRRLRSQERLNLAKGGKGLLLDTDLLKGFRGQGKILKWPCKESLVIDVTHIGVEEVVHKILDHLQLIRQQRE
ncbi:BgTH12-01886 [Blumeria graminis f. sp. triticale]|uniref:Bgt-1594 n=3 Tax=Blumeria graminis TaxID=34373 RepID=A0A061HE70_BLUGR|nr:hypothetical protein BGT96224_1594 [Blumeria graminis f. sp. tritici 96224]CAD6501636.1 BgTH12-01886 [Blumeria graminis f. sp. triticale]VDB84211.1 Bgt-1594 [Blumeria graminis f. sp. tritici]